MVLVRAAARRPFALVVCTWSLLLPLAAQQPAVAAGDAQIPVRIRVVEAGKQVPRIPEPRADDDAAAGAAFSVEGRKLEWRVGKNVCADLAAFETELQGLMAKKSNWHKPPGASREELIPVVIAPEPEVRWIDVLQCHDGAMKSGAYVYVAAGEYDYEARLRKGERFPR